jgi:hypothetical protein
MIKSSVTPITTIPKLVKSRRIASVGPGIASILASAGEPRIGGRP